MVPDSLHSNLVGDVASTELCLFFVISTVPCACQLPSEWILRKRRCVISLLAVCGFNTVDITNSSLNGFASGLLMMERERLAQAIKQDLHFQFEDVWWTGEIPP